MKNLKQFKANVDSITYEHVLELREQKEKHALKLEDLEITLKTANEYVEVIKEFLSELSFSKDRIDSFECRRKDGYFPHSYNKGGLEGILYRDQYSACDSTGFENTDEVLSKNADYDIECFAEENNLDKDKYSDWTEAQVMACDEYRSNTEDTVQFLARVMFTSETTVNVDFYVSASDSPYHRSSDDRLELEIEFKTPAGLRRKLKALLKNEFVKTFEQNVRNGF